MKKSVTSKYSETSQAALVPLSEILAKIGKTHGLNKGKFNHYKNLGLIKPSKYFEASRMYLYSLPEVVSKLNKIKELQEKGYSLTHMLDKI